MSQKGNRLRLGSRLDRASKTGTTMIKSTKLSKGSLKGKAATGIEYAHGHSKVSVSTSQLKPFDFYNKPPTTMSRPGTQSSKNFDESQKKRFGGDAFGSRPSFVVIGESETISGPAVPIKINSGKQLHRSSQQFKKSHAESSTSITKPLSEMERARKKGTTMNGKKFQQLMAILDSRQIGLGKKRSHQQANQQSRTSYGQLNERPFITENSKQMKTIAHGSKKTSVGNGGRVSSSKKFIQLYEQDSNNVPNHYCRPGPGDYEIDPRIGTKNHATQYTNSPAYTISKPKTIIDGFVTINHFKQDRIPVNHSAELNLAAISPSKRTAQSRSPSGESSLRRDFS